MYPVISVRCDSFSFKQFSKSADCSRLTGAAWSETFLAERDCGTRMSCWQLSHFNVVPAVARSNLSVVWQCGHWKTMSRGVFADDSEGSVEFVCIAQKKAKAIPPTGRDRVALLGFIDRGFL